MKTSQKMQPAPVCVARSLTRQRGMGATIILFTIALIVLVGAALAYASRGNPTAINTQGARVYSGVLLKQSADYRDAYSRYVFDGGVPGSMTFNASGLPTGDLFNPATQYGNYQAPPAQAMATGATAQWLYNKSITVTGVATGAADSVTYIPDVTQTVCSEVNNQMYGTPAVPISTGVALAAMAAASGTVIDTAASVTNRASGCFQTTDGKFVVYSTLAEN